MLCPVVNSKLKRELSASNKSSTKEELSLGNSLIVSFKEMCFLYFFPLGPSLIITEVILPPLFAIVIFKIYQRILIKYHPKICLYTY